MTMCVCIHLFNSCVFLNYKRTVHAMRMIFSLASLLHPSPPTLTNFSIPLFTNCPTSTLAIIQFTVMCKVVLRPYINDMMHVHKETMHWSITKNIKRTHKRKGHGIDYTMHAAVFSQPRFDTTVGSVQTEN